MPNIKDDATLSEITGKKLLVLGGKPAATSDIVSYATRQGVHTIVSDYLPAEQSRGKRLATESWMISTAEVDALVERCRQEGVDGVTAGAHEFNLERAMDVCERLGLPFYATREQWAASTDKTRFKQLCRSFDVPVVEDYGVIGDESRLQPDTLNYPILLKPTDNCGGTGIAICRDANQFDAALSKAMASSPSRRVLVEQLMQCPEVTIFYAMHNGEIHLTAMAERHVQTFQDGIIALPVAYVFPSRHLPRYRETLDHKVKAMFKSLGLRHGMLFIQSFIEHGDCVFYEMGYRLTGTLEYHLLDRVCGFNPMHMMVHLALTGESGCPNLREQAEPDFQTWCCNITFLVKPGKIGRIKGLDEIAAWPEIVAAVPAYDEGDVIEPAALGTLKQVVLRVFAVAPSKPELYGVMERVHRTIRVESPDGDSILLPTYDFSDQ